MNYKKPTIVARSAAKQTFVAGCPTNKPASSYCSGNNTKCMCGPLR